MGTATENGEKQGIEIEQRYLIRYLPPEILAQLTKDTRFTIDPQAYLSETKRVRRIKDPIGMVWYYKTTKIAKSGDDLPAKTSVKDEKEKLIDEEEFQDKVKTAKYTISKRRYSPHLGAQVPQGANVDFDVIRSGSLIPWRNIRRRMLVEIEFKSIDQARDFVPPAWFGANVTDVVSTRKLAKRNPEAVRTIRQSKKMPLFRG